MTTGIGVVKFHSAPGVSILQPDQINTRPCITGHPVCPRSLWYIYRTLINTVWDMFTKNIRIFSEHSTHLWREVTKSSLKHIWSTYVFIGYFFAKKKLFFVYQNIVLQQMKSTKFHKIHIVDYERKTIKLTKYDTFRRHHEGTKSRKICR